MVEINDLSAIEQANIHLTGLENVPIIVGPQGIPGEPNVLTIGEVSKGDEAKATITGDSPNQILNLVLPKGDKGDKGEQGVTGKTGPANSLKIGTVEKGAEASATITGEVPSQTLNLILPKGDKGDRGEKGEKGEKGANGYDDTEVKQQISDLSPHKHHVKITEGIQAEGELTLPFKYKVGSDCLDVYYLGERLVKDDTEKGIEGHYQEVGETGQTSNKIKVGWDVETETEENDSYFDFVVRGEYEGGDV